MLVMRYKVFSSILLASFVCMGLSSCNSCGDTERFIDDAGYGSWDIDGDGDAGRNVSFKGGEKGPCRECGLNYYGDYICPEFDPQSGSPTTCECGHARSEHKLKK